MRETHQERLGGGTGILSTGAVRRLSPEELGLDLSLEADELPEENKEATDVSSESARKVAEEATSDESQLLKQRGIESVQLAIELFNKPREEGRRTGVLLLLNHGLEMLLKCSIRSRGGTLQEGDNGHTIGFEACVNKVIYGERERPDVRFLDTEDADALRIINSLRDEAAHYLVELSEQQFYLHAKSGVSMADVILEEVYDERLADFMPERVLPLSTQPPQNIEVLINSEYEQIKHLIEQGEMARANAKARSIEAVERALEEDVDSPTQADVLEILDEIDEGRAWTDVFPQVASLNFTAEGEGMPMKFKLSRSEGSPVRVISEEEAAGDEPVIAEREVNPLDRYSLGVQKLATHLDINWVETWSVIRELDIHGDERYHKEVRIHDSQTQDRYTPATIELIQEAVESGEVDPVEARSEHWNTRD